MLRNEMHHKGFVKFISISINWGKYGTSSICSPRMIYEILPRFYHLFGQKSTSNLQLLDFILLAT